MATLRANGNEVLRIEASVPVKEGDLISDRRIRAYFENGVVLEKRIVKWPPTQLDPQGRVYTWGWKKVLTAKEAAKHSTPVAERIAALRKKIEENPSTMWKIV